MGTKPIINGTIDNPDKVKRPVAKPALKRFKSGFVKVTIEEINELRPSVYKYLLP